MDMILKTTDLCKNFKGQMAVNNVSLNIRRNSVYGLLGPNGEMPLLHTKQIKKSPSVSVRVFSLQIRRGYLIQLVQ